MKQGAKVALAVGGVGALGVAAYFLLKKPTPPSSSGGNTGGTAPPGDLPIPIFVGPANSGGTTTLNVGDILIASLPEDPSTGGIWTMSESGAPLISPVPDVVIPAIAPAIPAHTFTFKAVQPGQASLKATQTFPNGTTAIWAQAVDVNGMVATGGGGTTSGGTATTGGGGGHGGGIVQSGGAGTHGGGTISTILHGFHGAPRNVRLQGAK